MYYTIIDKEEFIALYNFGEIPFDESRLIITSESHDDELDLLLKALKKLPFFQYEEEVLILNLRSPAKEGIINIREIKELIPLSERAKSSYERKFDPRIRFQSPKFHSMLDDYFEYVYMINHKNGANALSEMCKCEYDASKVITEKEFKDSYYRRLRGERSQSFQGSFLTHLLVYDRYEYFPNTDLGFLYDIGTILANYKGRPNFIGSGLYTFLESKKDDLIKLNLSDILKVVNESPETESFRSALTMENGIRMYIVGAIFLKYKTELRNVDTIYDTSLVKVIQSKRHTHEFINEFDIGIYLTGLFFGFQKFNNDYYEITELDIFKYKKVKPKPLEQESINEQKEIESTKEVKDEITKEEMVEYSEEQSGYANYKKVKFEITNDEALENKSKAEEILSKIEEVFKNSEKESIRVSEIIKDIGGHKVGEIKKIVVEDPKLRFDIEKKSPLILTKGIGFNRKE